jgi:hypothetical protein
MAETLSRSVLKGGCQFQISQLCKVNEPQQWCFAGRRVARRLCGVRVAWEGAQSSRDRNAIYAYLTAVYGLVGGGRPEDRPSAPGSALAAVGGV